MNGLFLTCLLVSASAMCGPRPLTARIETLSQRLSTVGIEMGKAFAPTDHAKPHYRPYPVAGTGMPILACGCERPLPHAGIRPAYRIAAGLRYSSPIRGPSA
jgi:hypothetical protein